MYSSEYNRYITTLNRAVRDGDLIKIKDIVEKDGISSRRRFILIKNAFLYEEEQIARFLIEHNSAEQQQQNEDIAPRRETLLHLACGTEWNKSMLGKNVEIAKLLFERGAQVDARDEYGRTPLHYCRDIELARILLNKKASVYIRDKSGLTPLIRMLSNKRDAAFIRSCYELIDKYGLKPDQSEQYSLLKAWVDGNHDDAGFRELLRHGIDARARSDSGETVLHYAVRKGRASIVGVLRQYGIDVNAVDDKGRTLIHALLDKFKSKRDARTIRDDIDVLIRDNPEINVNIKDDNLRTPLHIATKLHWLYDSGILRSLLNKGADIFMPMSDGKTAFEKAAQKTQRIFIEHIAEHGGMMKIIDNNGNTALHAISASYESYNLSDCEIISLDGLNLNVVNKFGETPLQLASKAVRMVTVRYLLKNGAGKLIGGRTIDGLTRLHLASVGHIGTSFTKIIARHLRQGLDIDTRDKLGKTSLHYAIESRAESRIKQLLANGADGNAADNIGKNSLYRAIECGLLARHLAQGLGIDTKDKLGKTPLHYAIESRDYPKVRLLLDNGADVNAADHMGKNALYRAIESGSSSVLRLILDRGVDVSSRFFDGTTSLHLVIRLILSRREERWHEELWVLLTLLEHFEKNHLDLDLLQENDIHTPLYYAMQSSAKLPELPELFIRYGARLDKLYWIDSGKFLFLYLDNRRNRSIEGIVEKAFDHLLMRLSVANLGESHLRIRPIATHNHTEYEEKCHKEVAKLRRCKALGQLSYYDFLHNADPSMAKTVPWIDPDFGRLAVDFPIYGNLIEGKIKMDLFRNNLMPSASHKLHWYLIRSPNLSQFNIPPEIAWRILIHLSKNELVKFVGLSQHR